MAVCFCGTFLTATGRYPASLVFQGPDFPQTSCLNWSATTCAYSPLDPFGRAMTFFVAGEVKSAPSAP